MKKWQIIEKLKTGEPKLKTDEIVAILLKNRGLKTKREIEEFLNPPKPQTLTPKLAGIKTDQFAKAVGRIKRAIVQKQSIIVYSDYDADGVCGAAILWETLNKLGAKVMPYIPHRVEEGYGLSHKGIDFIKKEYDAKLIITVDHGIGSLEKINYAKKQGIEVIVTDHHIVPERLPAAYAIVHTLSLCGAGVVWVLAQALGLKRENQNSDFLDLVAIATIADMVPLTGANRILVKYGLEELNQTKRIGLKALIAEVGCQRGKIGVYEIGHILAPRLNAMGRMEHAMDSLRLLCTRDSQRASNLARHLDQTNRARQELMKQTLDHAKSSNQLTSQSIGKLIFIHHESYQQGVIGLVAGKLVEEFYRPAIVIWRGETFSKASARSINGFNIIEAIRKTQDLLVDAGGHPMAAGFTVETRNLEILQKRLTEIAEKELDEEKLTRVLKIDCEVGLEDLNFELYGNIAEFSPFGLGNPEPVFATRGVIVKDVRAVGSNGRHLKLLITHNSSPTTISAVAFGFGKLFPQLSPETPIDVAYTLSVDEWNGENRLELKIRDIKIFKQDQ
ncbi:MAG: single-stranded-DNA-specific exonuclease [Microgenomates group bacterium LiPW_16]|nr:MAG: single-stranded-DNA-specific exonuclease [Microgenomates group bacterium LiPW_16]